MNFFSPSGGLLHRFCQVFYGKFHRFRSPKIFFGKFCLSYPCFFEVPPRKFSGANFGINFRERTLGFFLPHFFGGTIACQYSVGHICLTVQCRRLFFREWAWVSAVSSLFCPSLSFFSFFWGRPGFPSLGWAAPEPTQVSGVPDSRIFTQELSTCTSPSLFLSLPLSWVGSFFSRSLSLSFFSLSLSLSFSLPLSCISELFETGLEESAGKEDPVALDSNLLPEWVLVPRLPFLAVALCGRYCQAGSLAGAAHL